MAASPTCQVSVNAGPYVSTTDGVNVAPGDIVVIKLFDLTDVTNWTIPCITTDDTTVAATINAGVVINNILMTATFTAPGYGKALRFQSQVNNGLSGSPAAPDLSLTTTFCIYVPTQTLGLRVGAFSEQLESSTTTGWGKTENEATRAIDLLALTLGSPSDEVEVSGNSTNAIPVNLDVALEDNSVYTLRVELIGRRTAPSFLDGRISWEILAQSSGGVLTVLPGDITIVTQHPIAFNGWTVAFSGTSLTFRMAVSSGVGETVAFLAVVRKTKNPTSNLPAPPMTLNYVPITRQLIAGPGISISPPGNLSTDLTISAGEAPLSGTSTSATPVNVDGADLPLNSTFSIRRETILSRTDSQGAARVIDEILAHTDGSVLTIDDLIRVTPDGLGATGWLVDLTPANNATGLKLRTRVIGAAAQTVSINVYLQTRVLAGA